MLSNEISAPYEVPKFPIEQLESMMKTVKKTSVCPSGSNQVGDEEDFLTENFVPHFQRVNISGEDITGEPPGPAPTGRHVTTVREPRLLRGGAAHQVRAAAGGPAAAAPLHEDLAPEILRRLRPLPPRQLRLRGRARGGQVVFRLVGGASAGPPGNKLWLLFFSSMSPCLQVHAPKSSGDHWEATFPPDLGYGLRMERGVFRVTEGEHGRELPLDCPDLETFVRDLQKMSTLIADGPLKTFCYKRLIYLSSKFQLHGLLNEIRWGSNSKRQIISHTN